MPISLIFKCNNYRTCKNFVERTQERKTGFVCYDCKQKKNDERNRINKRRYFLNRNK